MDHFLDFFSQRRSNVGERHSGATNRTAGRESASPGTSGEGEGETVTEHFSYKDFRTLLKLLKIKLPKKVLNDDVIRKSRDFYLSRDADIIVKKLQNTKLRVALKPRLQCRAVNQALKLKLQNRLLDMTEMIFFKKRKKNEKSLKEKWEKIPLSTRRGFRMKKTFTGPKNAVSEKMRRLKTQSQKNEMKCLQYFVKKKRLSAVRYKREHPVEFGFLSGRMDFFIKTNCNEAGASKYIMLNCHRTKKNLKSFIDVTEGRVSSVNLDDTHYCQTQAYLYLLKKTEPHADSVRAAVMIRKPEDDDDDEEEEQGEEEDQEETEEEEKESQDNEKNFKEYKARDKEPKGKFAGGFVSMREDTDMFEKLNKYCKKKAVPLYLAVLNKIFEKVEKNKKLIQTKIKVEREFF